MEAGRNLPEGASDTQSVVELRPGLTSYAGINLPAAGLVASFTGESFAGEIRTLGLVDDELNSFVAVLHSPERSMRMGQPEFRVWISVCQEPGFRLPRDALTILAITVFNEAGAAELATRVRASNTAGRRALHRLGFLIIGRETWHDGDRVILALRPETFPRWFRQWHARRRQVN